MSKLLEIAEERVLVLDGAMGTMIQRYKPQEEDFRNDELNFSFLFTFISK